MVIEPCTGCRYLLKGGNGRSYCRWRWSRVQHVYTTDTYTDRWGSYNNAVPGVDLPIWNPVDQTRAEGGICGPERKLYEPNRWERFKALIREVTWWLQ